MMHLAEPRTLLGATDILREHGESAKVIGGGTALVILMQEGLLRPDMLVALRRLSDVDGWRSIEEFPDAICIGGGVTLADLAQSSVARRALPSLTRAAHLVGNVRIRNVATVGGALAEADYAADLPAALVNLGAEVVVTNGRSERTLPSAEFFVDYYTTALMGDELVTHVRVPKPAADSVSAYVKFSSRSLEDRPCVVVAASARLLDDSRSLQGLDVVVGAIGPTPYRCAEALAYSRDAVLDDDTIAAVAFAYAQTCDPLDDLRGSSWYRRELVGVLITRALQSLRSGGFDG